MYPLVINNRNATKINTTPTKHRTVPKPQIANIEIGVEFRISRAVLINTCYQCMGQSCEIGRKWIKIKIEVQNKKYIMETIDNNTFILYCWCRYHSSYLISFFLTFPFHFYWLFSKFLFFCFFSSCSQLMIYCYCITTFRTDR